jgi:predicted CXXCH cytochrome family protein
MGYWRTLSLLALAAFWAQSPVTTPTWTVATAQSSAAAANASPAQNDATETSGAATSGSAAGQETTQTPLRGPEQPVPFSHKQHAGALQLPCEFCHATSRSGETVAIPQTALCMQCHQTIGTDKPGVQKLAAYAKSNTPIPWVRVYALPSFVTFSHKTHLSHGATCQQCHGSVAERVQLYKETDISMAACVNCHRAKQASIDCNTCHMLDQ